VRYLVDSDYLVDALAGIPTAVALLEQLADDGIGIGIVSYGEVFEGAFSDPDPQPRLARIRAFLARFALIDLSDPVMEHFARVRTDLRRQGMLIPDLDLLIATTALHRNLALVTRNARHFARIPGLTLYQPQ
jgi:tRNA(fMet)-specific endonuclease VapC